LGWSPLLAREAVYRTTEDAETLLVSAHEAMWEELAWNVRDLAALYDTHAWQPQMIEQKQSSNRETLLSIAVTPYVLEQYTQMPDVRVQQSPSINVLLDDYFAHREWRDALEGLRSPLRKVLQTQRDRCKRKAELLR